MVGKIYIASMNMRGKWADPIVDSIKLNVTSAQGKNNKNRLCFSPMTEINGGYKGYWNFEHYWQSGKVYEDIDISITKKWWKEQTTPKRRYPNSKNKTVLYALFDNNNEKMDYITSRKKVYVPEYYDLIKNRDMVKYWKDILKTHDINIKTYLYIMLPLIQVFIGLPIINYIDNNLAFYINKWIEYAKSKNIL